MRLSFAGSYAKELDQDETIWRSIPFFGTSLAVLGTALAGLTKDFPAADTPGPIALPFYALFAATVVAMAFTLAALVYATWPRRYAHPPFETDICNYVAGVEAYFRGARRRNPVLLTADRLRNFMIEQYAFCASQNRQINALKVRGRNFATWGLWVTLSLCMALGLMRFSHDRFAVASAALDGRLGARALVAESGKLSLPSHSDQRERSVSLLDRPTVDDRRNLGAKKAAASKPVEKEAAATRPAKAAAPTRINARDTEHGVRGGKP